jgi:hypothetical protein
VPYLHDYDECADYGENDENDVIVKKTRVCSGMRHVYEPLNS